MKLMYRLMNTEQMLSKDFDRGLADLKALAELAQPPAEQTPADVVPDQH